MAAVTRDGTGMWHAIPHSEAMDVLVGWLSIGADTGHVGYIQAREATLSDMARMSSRERERRKLAALSGWTVGGPSETASIDYLMDESNIYAIDTGVQRRKLYNYLVQRAQLTPSVGIFARWLKQEAQRLARRKTGKDTALCLIYAELYADCVATGYGLASVLDDTIPGPARGIIQAVANASSLTNQQRNERRAAKEAHTRMFRSELEFAGTYRLRTSVPTGNTDAIIRLMR